MCTFALRALENSHLFSRTTAFGPSATRGSAHRISFRHREIGPGRDALQRSKKSVGNF
jgi:hypothetical protein